MEVGDAWSFLRCVPVHNFRQTNNSLTPSAHNMHAKYFRNKSENLSKWSFSYSTNTSFVWFGFENIWKGYRKRGNFHIFHKYFHCVPPWRKKCRPWHPCFHRLVLSTTQSIGPSCFWEYFINRPPHFWQGHEQASKVEHFWLSVLDQIRSVNLRSGWRDLPDWILRWILFDIKFFFHM